MDCCFAIFRFFDETENSFKNIYGKFLRRNWADIVQVPSLNVHVKGAAQKT
jgi:hypothetical protein